MTTGYEIVIAHSNATRDRRAHSGKTKMKFAARRFAHAIFIAAMATTFGAAHAVADDSIGTAASVATVVTGKTAAASVTLKTGDGVFQNETLSSDTTGIGQFEFRDGTKLALGPGSSLVLDQFVYAGDSSKAKIVLNLTQGALRFITGNASHDAYQINTPTATIAVRGTAFDVYAKPDGEMAVAMINGAIEVCPHQGACRVHDVIGKFLTMTSDGVFSLRSTWDGTFLKGIPFKAALPFINDQSPLVPALKGSNRVVSTYITATGDTVKKAVRGVGKFPLFNPLKLFH
jgi:ferric-dicitrate binding protein FerR (iron transport regulator)